MTDFEGSWGAFNSHEPPVRLSDRSQIELSKLQARPKGKLSGWLAEAVENVPSQPKEGRVDTWLPQRSALIEASAQLWIDSLFRSLRRIVEEFDNSSASQQLPLVIDGPRLTMELPCRRDPSFAPYKFKCYEGHLTSNSWGLLIRSYYECMQIFIVPSQMLLGLETNLLSSGEVRMLAEFRPAVNETEVQWASDGITFSDTAIPTIARELFTEFVRLSLGIIKESELFAPKQNELKPTNDENGLISKEQEQFAATIKDLQLWQTRSLFSRCLSRDMESLAKLLLRAGLDEQLHQKQVESLCLQYAGLKETWDAFISKIESLTSGCSEL